MMDKKERELLKKLLDEQKSERQHQKEFIKKTHPFYDQLRKEGYKPDALLVSITTWEANLRVVEKI